MIVRFGSMQGLVYGVQNQLFAYFLILLQIPKNTAE